MAILEVNHSTQYSYSEPIVLNDHLLRLVATDNRSQKVISQTVDVSPTPTRLFLETDNESYTCVKMNFTPISTTHLNINTRLMIDTTFPELERLDNLKSISYHENTIAYLNESPELQPFLLTTDSSQTLGNQVNRLLDLSDHHLGSFIFQLLKWAKATFVTEYREFGAARMSSDTLYSCQGTCRDIAVLVMDMLRIAGVPAGFVSGYYYDTSSYRETYDLHAWIQCYVPELGWVGLDPGTGECCSDKYIKLCSSFIPINCSPVDGTFMGSASSTLKSCISINSLPG
ncbi:hypothetical protein DID80_06335 [Candidatus Marinamargulisbacteria bacterium SCGC AAA071-K20]|nr:hypothetical protein DID80_06335 [Candidatus Marinamargulisbacteria bacterium SCGC AAA071-K20]